MTDVETHFDALLDYLKRTRGFDFTAYKRPSLMRRVQKRMSAVSLESFVDYTDYLEVHPDEFAQLFNVILINVTSFFRDAQTWDFIRDETIPELVKGNDAIRVWSAGCASGEEPYSVAMLLADALGPEQFRDRVKIYATDADEDGLGQARQGVYSAQQVEHVPAPFVERYFARDGAQFVFDTGLRRSVIFGRHDLIHDAPISRANLLVCRNTLMYFNTEAQSRILARFHFALAPGGSLFLGKAEMLLTHSPMFAPVDLRRRVFRKVHKDNWRDRMAILNQAEGAERYGAGANHTEMYSASFDANPVAQIVLDAAGALVLYNERAKALFGIGPNDVGRPVQDLELSYRPAELRSVIAQAHDQHRPITLNDVEWVVPGREPRFYDVHIVPLFDETSRAVGVSIMFADVSRVQELQTQLTRSKQDLETAYEELQSTNEELETTNEELQSTVEELETTNEELQSTNEELETMNEELQSTNEELQTMNQELRERSDAVTRANGFLESILTSVRSGVIVVDRDFHVIAWNHRSEDLWGLRGDEVKGQNVLTLDIGLPVDEIRTGIRACLAGETAFSEGEVTARNRRGRSIECRVICTPLMSDGRSIAGAILLIEELTPEQANA